MARRFDLIVFDWDGTLMDSTAAIARAIQSSAEDLGLPIPSDEKARHVIGLGLRDALALAVPELPQARYAELLQELKSREHCLAVATGKSRSGLNDVLARSGLESLMHATRCADECFSKPHPQMLEELMDELAVAPEATVMIGDTIHDLQMAMNADVTAVAVSYGAHERVLLAAENPAACCDTVEALSQWLRRNA